MESRLIWRENGEWQMENGPFARLPKDNEGDWTLLVQSVDLHSDAAAELMQQFRFIPDARLDDVMISIASHGGGVGPHFDSYDVFLLQAAGQREWRYGHQKDLSLEPGLPLKILSRFEPEASAVLSPGDMLYLPPQAAHDGIAVGDGCMTISIGFARPRRPRWRAGCWKRPPTRSWRASACWAVLTANRRCPARSCRPSTAIRRSRLSPHRRNCPTA